jgi:hypothetical protein
MFFVNLPQIRHSERDVPTKNSGSPRGAPQIPPLRYAPVGMTISLGSAGYRFQDELSSRPERTRISCHAALDKAACAPFCKGKAHEVHQRHQVPQEIRGSVVEGSAVRPSNFPNSSWIDEKHPKQLSAYGIESWATFRLYLPRYSLKRSGYSCLSASTLGRSQTMM